MDYLKKYLKYKNKYLKLKNLKGGVLSEKSKTEITKWREPQLDSITLPKKNVKELFTINSKLYDYISSLPLLPDNNTYIFDNLVDILELTSEDFSDILVSRNREDEAEVSWDELKAELEIENKVIAEFT